MRIKHADQAAGEGFEHGIGEQLLRSSQLLSDSAPYEEPQRPPKPVRVGRSMVQKGDITEK